MIQTQNHVNPDTSKALGILSAPKSPITQTSGGNLTRMRGEIRSRGDRLYSRPVKGFTLIELLVVITILGILMSLGVSGASAIRNQAKNAQARNDCTGLSTAIKAFYTDYSRYPTVRRDDVTVEPSATAPGNSEVIGALTATDASLNPRQVLYYENKTAKKSKTGTGYVGGLAEGSLFDPWGMTYGVLLDGDFDGKLQYSGTGLDLPEEAKTILGGVGVFSLGNNKDKGILSWQ
jgi:prepilin-type N-terminal cleavage/methylation domain-containing protein